MSNPSEYTLLNLLQFADSALPIGATAHSFGLETLTVEEALTVEDLPALLEDYLSETGVLESVYCRATFRAFQANDWDTFVSHEWIRLNSQLSAWKMARESRSASGTLGRRLLRLVAELEETGKVAEAADCAGSHGVEAHHCVAFGLVGAVLRFDEDTTVLAFLQQAVTAFISACQRLLPLGQSRATRLLWELKSALVATSHESKRLSIETVGYFAPLPELGSMRHPTLATRLFIS